MNIFIRDYLQPDKEFHNLYNNAIDSLYKELQRLLRDTFYGIHNLIEVSCATTFPPPLNGPQPLERKRRGKRIGLDAVNFQQNP